MAKLATREQNIKRARMICKFDAAMTNLTSRFGRSKSGSSRKEVFIETEFGRVRTLWYGLDNTEKAPLFIGLHGGGFILRSVEQDEVLNTEFNQRVGCKVVGIDYAKAPDFPFPAAVNQIYAVVKHIHDNAEKYGIDRHKMAIGGHSAGGNLSTVTCMKAKEDGEFQFVCQVLDFAPFDLATSPFDKPQPKGSIPPKMALMFDSSYAEPTQLKDPHVSPVYATEEDLTGLPPALFIVAGRDSLHDEALKYQSMLEAAGVATERHDYPNATHGFTYRPSADTTDAVDKMVAFLAKHLTAKN